MMLVKINCLWFVSQFVILLCQFVSFRIQFCIKIIRIKLKSKNGNKYFRRIFSFATHNGWCRWSITSQDDTTAAILSVIVRHESSALYATFEYLGPIEKKVSDSGLGNLLGILNSYVPQPMLYGHRCILKTDFFMRRYLSWRCNS